MDLMEKLTILTEGAKYDAACTSSGSKRSSPSSGIGNSVTAGCCHSFSADGRCISLLKVLMTNYCVYDCAYCVNRASNDVQRTAFIPEELAQLTIEFYRRNYIEGLFLSSGVMQNPDYTMERMIRAIEILRYEYGFWGYIHAKAIPGASQALIEKMGLLVDRISTNVELPSEDSLKMLAPDKTRKAIFNSMGQITGGLKENKTDMAVYRHAPKFAPGGQATQMIIGATKETDYQIIKLSSSLYKKYNLRRVFFSAYIPAVEHALLPAKDFEPPLLREHRLYQADWLIRKYQFDADEILSEAEPNFNPFLDPKCNWAINNMGVFPIDVNTADHSMLLRVPGIGPTSAKRIVIARRTCRLGMDDLKKIGVVLKRARYFITARDYAISLSTTREETVRALIDPQAHTFGMKQLSLFDNVPELSQSKSIASAAQEVISCLSKAM